MFIDGGISKPLYSNIRNLYIHNSGLLKNEIEYVSFLYSLIFIILIIVVACSFLVCLFLFYSGSFNWTVVVSLAINVAINIQITFYKNLLYSINNYIYFDFLELIRKTSNLCCLLLFSFFHNFEYSININIIILSIILAFLMLKFKRQGSRSKLSRIFVIKVFFSIKKYTADSINYLIFTFSELTIYYSGFVLVPLFLNNNDSILYGIWSKLFFGFSLIIYSFAELNIHEITKLFFLNQLPETIKRLNSTLILLLIIMTFSLFLLYNFRTEIFIIWTNGKYQLDSTLFISLSIWVVANCIQHIAGSFQLSVGSFFKIMKIYSLVIGIVILLLGVFTLYYTKSLELYLLSTSIIYLIGSFSYYRLMKKQF